MDRPADQGEVVPSPDRGWRVAAVGDYDGDGRGDIAWQHELGAGVASVWFMNGLDVERRASLWTLPDPTWRIQGDPPR